MTFLVVFNNMNTIFIFINVFLILPILQCKGAEIYLQNVATQEILELQGDPTVGGAIIRGVTKPTTTFKRSHLWETDWETVISTGVGILSSIPDQRYPLALDEDRVSNLVASWSYFGAFNQQWTVTIQNGDTYLIINKATGRCLTCPRGSQARTVVCDPGDSAQLWTIGTRKTIRNVGNKQYLDVNNGPQGGAIIHTKPWSGLQSQTWGFIFSITYGLSSKLDAGDQGLSVTLVLDEDKAKHTVATWGFAGYDNQYWYFRRINGQPYYQIANIFSNRCLQSQGLSQAITVSCNAEDSLQLWEINQIIVPAQKIWKNYKLGSADLGKDLTRVFVDQDVAIYTEPGLNYSIEWTNKFLGDVWRYVKKVYGGTYGINNQIHAVFNKVGTDGTSTAWNWFGEPSGYPRNILNMGGRNWADANKSNKDTSIHEISHIVEGNFEGFSWSPGRGVWADSMFAEIFIYDIYIGLGMTSDANSAYEGFLNNGVDVPTKGRLNYWFRDWYYPIWSRYGKTTVLVNFFKLVAQYWPKHGNELVGGMNVGQFVHFYSGAAGVNLKNQATTAFGWSAEYETQFKNAQTQFPAIKY